MSPYPICQPARVVRPHVLEITQHHVYAAMCDPKKRGPVALAAGADRCGFETLERGGQTFQLSRTAGIISRLFLRHQAAPDVRGRQEIMASLRRHLPAYIHLRTL